MRNNGLMIKPRHSRLLAFALLTPMLFGCTSNIGPQAPMKEITDVHTDASQYVIGPGDHLQIFVYEAPMLSVADTPVRPDGRLSLPLVPDLDAAGKTPSQLAHDITERLKEYVKDPNVSVIVHSFVGTFDRQIKIIGEATEPMSLPYSDRMTILDVVIAAKGLTKYAAGNRAIIVRRIGGKQETIHVHLDDLLKNGDVSQNIEMQAGDTLIIPQTYF